MQILHSNSSVLLVIYKLSGFNIHTLEPFTSDSKRIFARTNSPKTILKISFVSGTKIRLFTKFDTTHLSHQVFFDLLETLSNSFILPSVKGFGFIG